MPIPLLALMAAGAIAGGAMNKKNRLKGALMGAGLGATGGLLAPAAMGAAGAAGAGAASAVPAGVATSVGTSAATTASPGLLGMMSQYGPVLQQGMGLLGGGEQQPIEAPGLIPQQGGGAQTLTSLAQQGGAQGLEAEAQRRRQRRMGLLGGGV